MRFVFGGVFVFVFTLCSEITLLGQSTSPQQDFQFFFPPSSPFRLLFSISVCFGIISGGKKSEGLGISLCSYSFFWGVVWVVGWEGRQTGGEGAYDDSAGGVGLRCFRMDGGEWTRTLTTGAFLYAV